MSEVLTEIRLGCGVLHVGDEFFYHRRRGSYKTGWLKARSIDYLGRWVNGVDGKGAMRSIEIESITTIRKPGRKPLSKGV
jgi:hypothetical protein